MALNIKSPEVERLAREIAAITVESMTEVIRKALLEMRRRLSYHVVRQDRRGRLLKFLQQEIWPTIPSDVRGKTVGREEWDRILGLGKEGV